jgi:hypothetical protein
MNDKTFKFNANIEALIDDSEFKTQPGIYYTTIIDAQVDTTKNGSPLLRLTLKPECFDFTCKIALCVSLNPFTHRIFGNFCESIGLNYPESGEILLEDIIGKSGFVKYIWQPEFTAGEGDYKKYLIAKRFVKKTDAHEFRDK